VRKLIISEVSQLQCYPNQLTVAKIPALALVIGVVAGVIVLITVVVLTSYSFSNTTSYEKAGKKCKKIIALVAELQITFKIFALVI